MLQDAIGNFLINLMIPLLVLFALLYFHTLGRKKFKGFGIRYIYNLCFIITVHLLALFPLKLWDIENLTFTVIIYFVAIAWFGIQYLWPAILFCFPVLCIQTYLQEEVSSIFVLIIYQLIIHFFLICIPHLLFIHKSNLTTKLKITTMFYYFFLLFLMLFASYSSFHMFVYKQPFTEVWMYLKVYSLYFILLLIVVSVIMRILSAFINYIRLQEELEIQENSQLVSDLAASVAHEVRNPLTVVHGFVQILQKDAKSKKSKEMFDIILSELIRSDEIISDYLALANNQSIVRKNVFHLSKTLENINSFFSPFAKTKNIQLNCVIEDGLYVAGVEARIKQALLNLLKNSVESIAHENGIIQFTAQSGEGEVRILIKDNGIGMTKDELANIGLSYFTTKREGTGLGFLVTKQIVEVHKGKISVESERGLGTTIEITLPLHIHK